ncbi:hypothetical protein Cgig2_002767 [Carnegiea gigantea]|uniref:Uncharacterized protein n=1 Tax=Carnegiea gigantea TaxID=171969 RepID=A0A9Q1GZG8_9CARY|nr:hypothetical protein Cgig2_002767 [Carnegiea gigantea]
MKLKLTYQRNWHAWHEKTMSAQNLLHQLMALCEPLNHHSRNVELKENPQLMLEIIEEDVRATLALLMGYFGIRTKNKYPRLLELWRRRMLEIIKEDIHATLALPMGPLEVYVASAYKPKNKYSKLLEVWWRRWNLGRTGTQKRKEKQRLMVSHNKHGTTDAVEQKYKDKKKFLRELVNLSGAWNGQVNR